MMGALRAVFWSFLGVRRRSDYSRDARTLTPQAVVGAGLVLAALFVLALIGIVSLVTAR